MSARAYIFASFPDLFSNDDHLLILNMKKGFLNKEIQSGTKSKTGLGAKQIQENPAPHFQANSSSRPADATVKPTVLQKQLGTSHTITMQLCLRGNI